MWITNQPDCRIELIRHATGKCSTPTSRVNTRNVRNHPHVADDSDYLNAPSSLTSTHCSMENVAEPTEPPQL